MTDDFHLFDAADGDGPLDPDTALLSAYLARELSPMQVLALEERLATDSALRAKAQPLFDAWAAPIASLAGEARLPVPASNIERAAGWQRFQTELQSETVAASPVRRRIPMRRIAAIVTLVVLPMLGVAQLMAYVAGNASMPGHTIAKSILRRDEASAPPQLPENVQEGPTTRPLTLQPRAAAQGVPVVDVPAPAVKSTRVFGAIASVKQTPDGRVLVSDAFARQLVLVNRAFDDFTVVMDSTPGQTTSYGRGNVPKGLGSYIGDSLLFPGENIREFVVLDPYGKFVRAQAGVALRDVFALMEGRASADAKGRFFYMVPYGYARSGDMSDGTPPKEVEVPFEFARNPRRPRPGAISRGGGPPPTGISVPVRDDADSLRPIRRVDFDARRVDTIGYVSQPRWGLGLGADGMRNYGNGRIVVTFDKAGAPSSVKQIINPLYYVDDWALLSDGTVGIVRGRDYHVDWIHPDGSKTSSPKLPYEWKRLTDDDKQRIADSTKADVDSVEAWAQRRAAKTPAPGDSIPVSDTITLPNGRRGGCANPKRPGIPTCPYEVHEWAWEVVSLSEIADYYPPFRIGTALADADGNLWILPRTSSLSKKGELVYDIVNPKRGLVQRARLPLGRSIAGFGKGGVIYLQAGDLIHGFTLERSTVPGLK